MLKVSRTLADLEGKEAIESQHASARLFSTGRSIATSGRYALRPQVALTITVNQRVTILALLLPRRRASEEDRSRDPYQSCDRRICTRPDYIQRTIRIEVTAHVIARRLARCR